MAGEMSSGRREGNCNRTAEKNDCLHVYRGCMCSFTSLDRVESLFIENQRHHNCHRRN